MKNILFFFCIALGFLASAQQKKKDSIDFNPEFFNYKPRLYRPSDCFCPNPDKPIERKSLNPYQYEFQNPVKIDSADWDRIKDYIIRKA